MVNITTHLDLKTLNSAQKCAVLAPPLPLLVLAGAGSGKTRVLTTRIAHMVCDMGIDPFDVLAITFTNKAAQEMRERLGGLLGPVVQGMWIATFHSMAVRMLRQDAEAIGYRSNFSIYDETDSKRLVKEVMSELYIDSKVFSPSLVRSRISHAKNAMISQQEMASLVSSPPDEVAARVWQRYQERLLQANAMDFDDLLLNAYELLVAHSPILKKYQKRFKLIAVDEYQDTNHVQYLICNLLAQKNSNITVVGDDDQSIYSWRGADITNILEFEKDYPDAQVVKLEQNYRSSGHVLAAANAVVAHNQHRKSKELYTKAGMGELIRVYQAPDEREEARWVAAQAAALKQMGHSYNDMAVFYRTNVQSRVLEDMFLRAGVPYQIAAGTRFFDRAEIRDVAAYLKLVANNADDVSAMRIINTPRRGIGAKTQARLGAFAQKEHISYFEACKRAGAGALELSPKVVAALKAWTDMICAAAQYEGELANVVSMIVHESGLIAAYEQEGTNEAATRIDNINEFLLIVKEFDEEHPNLASQDALGAFLEWLALRTDLDTIQGSSDTVTLMTIHSAKGLEFPVVFVTGLEEGLFPNTRLGDSDRDIEEERRLAYVAITRARERLYLTHAATRRTYGSVQANPASTFLLEIPQEHVRYEGLGSAGFWGTGLEKRGSRHGMYGAPVHSKSQSAHVYADLETDSSVFGAGGGKRTCANKDIFALGDIVHHKTFGRGRVVNISGDELEIVFEKSGATKKLLSGFAPLVKIVES